MRLVKMLGGGDKSTEHLSGNSGFITEHPEAAYKKKLHAGAFTSVEGRGIKASAQGAKRSIEVPIEMITMTVGDLDLDGEEEVLIMSQNQLQLYDITEKGLELIGQTTLPRGKRNHAINIADINGDNVKEIYVSATQGLDVSSMIWTWDKGDGFTLVADRIPWYLRPVEKPGDGWILMGQKRGLEKIDFMQPGIYVLELATDYEIVEQKKVGLPPKVNLFDFVFADLNGDGSFETITIDHLEKMKVYNSIHELLWVSKRSFGGSNIYLGPSQGEAADDVDRWGLTVDEEALREPIFVPNTVLVKDFDKDGSQEIIVNENKSNYLDIFYKLRIYDSSLVVGLHWNGEGMDEVWRTGKYDGLIAAYNFASTNNEKEVNSLIEQGKNPTGRLFIGHVPAKGTLRDMLPGGLESELKVYDLEFIEEAAPQ